jgi:hypothetical protein
MTFFCLLVTVTLGAFVTFDLRNHNSAAAEVTGIWIVVVILVAVVSREKK